MSFIQIACAVAVPLLWGCQFVAIKLGAVAFPPLFFLALRFLAIALLLVVGAAFAFAVSNVLTKRHGPFDPLMLMGWSSLLTVPQVMSMSLLLEHGQMASLAAADERGWLALAYTIFIGGIVGFGLWFWLIARCSMGRVAPFGLLLPMFALMASVLFLGDRVTPKLIVGGLLAISGVAITQVGSRTKPT